MKQSVLLIGRNQKVLALLKEALEEVGLTVFVTDRVEQAAVEFNATNFDLIAFGRGVDEPLNKELRAVFSNQRSDGLFVNGLAPVVPLLVKQILFAMRRKPEVKNVLSDFRYQIAEPITVVVTLTEPTQLTVGISLMPSIAPCAKCWFLSLCKRGSMPYQCR